MSRAKRSDPAHAYAAVRFVCPHGHRQKPQALRIDEPSWLAVEPPRPTQSRYVLNRGIERVDAPDGSTKLRLSCSKCIAAGRRSDLQASWDRTVMPLLDAIHGDPTRGTVDLHL